MSQPLEVELGSGDGSFLVNYAALHPERNFIGTERLMGRLKKIDKKGRRLKLVNVRGVRMESVYFLEYLLPRHCAEAIHVYFPDPWPKRKHWGNRIINEAFPALASRVLKPTGRVYLRTDHPDYFVQMQDVFSRSPLFREVATPEALAGVVTDFEREFNAQGILTRRAAYERTSEAPVTRR